MTQYKLEPHPRCWSWTGLNKCYVFLVTLFWKTCRNMSGLQWLQWLQWRLRPLRPEHLLFRLPSHTGKMQGTAETRVKVQTKPCDLYKFYNNTLVCWSHTTRTVRSSCDSLLGSFAKESWECRFEKRWLEDLLVVQLFWSSRRCRPLSFAIVEKSEVID